MAISVVNEPKYSIGGDVGGSGFKVAVIERDSGGEHRNLPGSYLEVPSNVKNGPAYVTDEVIPAAIKQSLAAIGIRPGLIESAGFDFPCAVDSEQRTTLDVANMSHREWLNFPAGSSLDRSLGEIVDFNPRVIAVDNDCAATMHAVVSELPVSQRRQSIIGLFVGTGLGGAAILEGANKFSNCSGGSEPGASKLVYDEGTILLGSPSGAALRKLEEFASITGLERQIPLMARAGVIPNSHPLMQLQASADKSEWRVRAEHILKYASEAFANGDLEHFALRPFILQREVLGMYLQILTQFNRPDHVFIGGGVVDSRRVSNDFAQWYVQGIRSAMIGNIAQPARQEGGIPEFHIPNEGDYTAPIGAALMAAAKLQQMDF